MFVWGFFCPTREFFILIECHPYRWRAAKFDLCSALMAIEQWEIFSVPHLLWHGTSIYTGHLRDLVTVAPVAKGLAGKLSLPVLTTRVFRDRRWNPDFVIRNKTLMGLNCHTCIMYIWNPFIQGYFVPGLVEVGSMVLQKRFQNVVIVFSLCHCFLLKFFHPRMLCATFD